MCTIDPYVDGLSPFVSLAFDIINEEVIRYQIKLAGGKVR